jgi:hypothetical protein
MLKYSYCYETKNRRDNSLNIKRFIKYKGYPYFRTFLKNKARLKLPITFLTVGASLIGFDIFKLFLSLVGDVVNANNFEFIPTIVGLLMIAFSFYWGNRLMLKQEKNSSEKSRVTFKHFSIESSEKNDLSNNPKNNTYILLDQRQQQEETLLNWIKKSLSNQEEALKDYYYVAERWDQPISLYEGLAHIPYVFLLGFQISDKRDMEYLEWNEHVKKWEKLPQSVPEHPPLFLDKNLKESEEDAKEVAICISLTEEILQSQLSGLDASNVNLYHLHLETCGRHAIVSQQQLSEYKEQFRRLIDSIYKSSPNLNKIHLFISAQTSLVFNLGSSITRNDVEIWIYNFDRNNNIKYPWSLKAHKYSNNNDVDKYIRIEVGA